MSHEGSPEDMLRQMIGGEPSDLTPAIVASRAQRAYRQLDAAAHQRDARRPHADLEIIEIYDPEAGTPDEHYFYFCTDSRGYTMVHAPQPDGSSLMMRANFARLPRLDGSRKLASMAVMATIIEERLERLDEPGVWAKVHTPPPSKH